MRTLLARSGAALLLCVSQLAVSGTDAACMQRCANAGSLYNYCQGICTIQQPSPGYYDVAAGIRHPDFAGAYMEGRRKAEELRRMEAETRQAEAQAKIAEQQAARGSAAPNQTPSAAVSAYQRWTAAAQQRSDRFPDFREVVFAQDVSITTSMIEWMSHSKYAADIAYFLATHKVVAAMVAQQPATEQAASLERIEADIAAAEQK